MHHFRMLASVEGAHKNNEGTGWPDTLLSSAPTWSTSEVEEDQPVWQCLVPLLSQSIHSNRRLYLRGSAHFSTPERVSNKRVSNSSVIQNKLHHAWSFSCAEKRQFERWVISGKVSPCPRPDSQGLLFYLIAPNLTEMQMVMCCARDCSSCPMCHD